MPIPVRGPHIRAALPPIDGEIAADIGMLRRFAAALRADPGGHHRARPAVPADIARLRRDMGETIAALWAAPCEVVRRAC